MLNLWIETAKTRRKGYGFRPSYRRYFGRMRRELRRERLAAKELALSPHGPVRVLVANGMALTPEGAELLRKAIPPPDPPVKPKPQEEDVVLPWMRPWSR